MRMYMYKNLNLEIVSNQPEREKENIILTLIN